METHLYQGQRIYVPFEAPVTSEELQRAKTGLATILDTYFFKFGSEKVVEKAEFDRAQVETLRVGLMVTVKSQFEGQFLVPLFGLDTITQFFYDTASLGKDVSVLKGKKVTEYRIRRSFSAISVNNL